MTIESAFFGVVAKDAQPKISAGGKPYMRINMRVGDGDTSQWIMVTVFGDMVAALDGRAVRGAKLYVEGRLTLDKWKTQDGTERTGLSVAAWKCEPPLIGRNKKRKQSSTTEKSKPAPKEPPPFDDAIGF